MHAVTKCVILKTTFLWVLGVQASPRLYRQVLDLPHSFQERTWDGETFKDMAVPLTNLPLSTLHDDSFFALGSCHFVRRLEGLCDFGEKNAFGLEALAVAAEEVCKARKEREARWRAQAEEAQGQVSLISAMPQLRVV